MNTLLIPFSVVATLAVSSVFGNPASDFQSLPESADPLKIGKLVAERFVESPHPNFGYR